jgi:hypothetical protein
MHAQIYLTVLLPLLSAAMPLASPQDHMEQMPTSYRPPPQCWIDAQCEWDPIKNTSKPFDLSNKVPPQFQECYKKHICDTEGKSYTLEHRAPCSRSGWCDYAGNEIKHKTDGAHIALPTSSHQNGPQ